MKTTLPFSSLLSLFSFLLPLFSQASGTLSFFVRDAENGYGVASEIFITGNGKSDLKRTTEGGRFVFQGEEGLYNISISSPLHQTLTTYFTITTDHTINVEVLLDRKNKTVVTYEKLNHALIEGYIIDAETGKPLKGITALIDGITPVVSGENGYFSLVCSEYSEMNTAKDLPIRKSVAFSAPGYISHTIQDLFMAPTVIKINVALKKGSGQETKKEFQHILDGTTADAEEYNKNVPQQPESTKVAGGTDVLACSLPTSVRVGTSCSCTTCSGVSVMTLQYYSESGIDDEWIASWQFESLAAGSIPYRSYGGWYVNNPVNVNYDIASSTCNQVWGPTVYANPQAAAQATTGDMLTADGVNPARSEYSAQNNYGGTSYNCGDCQAGGSGLYACYSDNVCCGYTPAGHGRGMCQWGSQYWAQASQTHQWMINHYFIATVGYSLCSTLSNPPASLSVAPVNCPSLGVNLNWQNSGTGWFIDITDDAGWSYFYNKNVSNLTTTPCPGSFELYPSTGTYLQFLPNTTYYWRIWDGNAHTYGQPFTTPYCAYSDNVCSGSFTDYGGSSAAYTSNEDWDFTISPANALNVTVNFSAFDLEDQYDYLNIYDGNSTAAPLIGSYTGLVSPGNVTSSGPSITFRFMSDPLVNNAGWQATWSCTLNTTGLEENNSGEISVYPNPFTEEFGVWGLEFGAEIQLFNSLGELIYIWENTSPNHKLLTPNLAEGIYYLQIQTPNGVVTKKLVKGN